MTDYLKALTAPRTIALVGASNDPARLTARPMLFMQQHGFAGAIYPVNPKHKTVQGLVAYPSVAAIPDKIDHAMILVGTEHVVAAMQDCARAGVKVVSVLADGFAETGPRGRVLQNRLVEIAQSASMLLIGPNSMGVVDTRGGFCATTNAVFKTDKLNQGRLAVISQSGSLIGTLVSRGDARGIAFSTLISVGNEAGASAGDLGSILLQDDGIDGFVLFMETIRKPDALAEFARKAHAAEKPVVAYMLGKSDEAQALAVSHTGALTGRQDAVDAYLTSVGIAQVSQFDALIEAPAALMKKSRLRGRPKSVTVVTTTGGGGAMAIDRLSLQGVEIAGCSSRARQILAGKGINLSHGKLVDVTLAGARYDTMKAVVTELINDPRTGALLVAIGSSAQFNPELAVTPVIDAVAESSNRAAPVFALPIPHATESIRLLEKGGVPAFRSVESCADCLALVVNARAPAAPVVVDIPIVAKKLIDSTNRGVMNEVNSGAVFAALGVSTPVQTVLAADVKVPEINGITFPVVAKLVSRDIAHKSEAGAVQTGLNSLAELQTAIDSMRDSVVKTNPDALIEGILVQQQCNGLAEALIGFTRDPLVGPVVTLAAGGVMTEIYQDTSVRPAPVSIEAATEMIDEIKAFALLRGYRGRPKGDLQALAKVIVAVSSLATTGEIEEAEINPLLVCTDGVVMLDALIRKV